MKTIKLNEVQKYLFDARDEPVLRVKLGETFCVETDDALTGLVPDESDNPTLRDITLFHETLNKDRQPFVVTMGEPISASAIPRDPEQGIALLRAATLALGGEYAPVVNLIATTRPWLSKGAPSAS